MKQMSFMNVLFMVLISVLAVNVFAGKNVLRETRNNAFEPESSEGLKIIKRAEYDFSIQLNGEEIYISRAADVSIHKSYKDIGGMKVDILHEYSGGNICLAFTYRVIGWRPDGTHFVSEKFGNCRGPHIQQEGNKITLSFESYVARHSGTAYPAETWEYENGVLHKVQTPAGKQPAKKAVKKVPAEKKTVKKETPKKTPADKRVKKKAAKKEPVKKAAKKAVPKKIPMLNKIYRATRDKTSKLVFVGRSACCNCVCDSEGKLPADFPSIDVHYVTFYLLASRSSSVYNRIQVGETMLKFILGDSEAEAETQQLSSEAMDPVRHTWYVQFNFDPPVSVEPSTEWKLLDGDGTWKSAAIAHTSSKASGGLPGKYITKNCPYARTEDAWYSVKFDFSEAQPVPSPLSVTASASKTSGSTPLALDFTGTTTGGTPPYTYFWDFGDGSTSSSQNPFHIYSTAGTYQVSLTATDSQNTESSFSLTILATAPESPYNVYVDIKVFDPGGKYLFKRPNQREGWDTEGNLPSEFSLMIEICDANGVPISGGTRNIQFESNERGGTAKVIPTVTIGPLREPSHHYRLALWENDSKDRELNPGDPVIWSRGGEHRDFSRTQVTLHGNNYYGVEECKGSGKSVFNFNDPYAFRHKSNDNFTIVKGILGGAGPEYEKAYILVKVRK